MEKQTSNFALLLKQGFKGIFKFRVQFIIILILSFLATLVLTISVSTSRRLGSAYNQIVKKVEPFDFAGTTRISKTAVENSGGANMNEFRSVALMDFINHTFVNTLNTDEDGNEFNNSSFNFIFNSQPYDKLLANTAQSFLTKVINQTDGQGFYQLSLKFYQDEAETARDDWQWALKESFAAQLIKDLILYRNNPSQPAVGYLTSTSLGFLLKTNSHFLDFLNNKFNKDDFYNFTNDQQRFIRYIFWIGAQISAWISNQDSIFASVEEKSIFEGIATTPEEKAEVFYEFITGKTFNNQPPKQVKFIIQDVENGTDVYTLETTYNEAWDPANEKKYLTVTQETQLSPFVIGENQRKALKEKGYRGITSPLSIKVGEIRYLPGQGPIEQPYQGIKDVDFTQNYEEFSLMDRGNAKPLTKEISLSNEFNLAYDIMDRSSTWSPILNNHTKASMMQYHIELNALSAGFNARFRKESIVFDNITSRKFRFVILNGKDNANFTVLRGTAPVATNEVAISEQFGQANKIKIGQYLKIGQASVMVTGFATDAFTFFPNVDPDFPVPQPKTEALIYGSSGTLAKITEGDGEGTEDQNANPQMFSFFLTNNQKQNFASLAAKKDLFVSLQMDLAGELKNNLLYLNSLTSTKLKLQNLKSAKIQATNSSLSSFFNLKDFKSSNYRYSWTLLPLVLTTFQIITYVSSLVIAIIAIIALVICIRKTISFNAKQIGILKALGTNPWMISVTYLAHAIVIVGIVIPCAWIIGTGLQIPFAMMFTQYFSAPSHVVLVDWISIIIAFFGFGILAFVTSIVAAYLVTRKPVVDIIDVSIKWSSSKLIDKLNNSVFKNASFNYRFSLTLSSSGKKPIALLVTVVGLTSLLISGAIAVPAIANNVISSYYKSVKYANAYENMTPTVNSPLSKPAINFWQGNEKWDKDWRDATLKLDGTETNYGYYLDPEGYMDSASQASPIPKYVFFKDEPSNPDDIVQNFTYAYAYLLKHPGKFLDLAGDAFGDNFYTVLGQTFNIGTVDQFFGLILNADYQTIRQWMGNKYNEEWTLDANKQKLAVEFSGSLTLALPSILSIIFSATSGSEVGPGTGDNWKDEVINVIMTQVPPFVRSYIDKSNSRKEQFAISFNADTYVPKEETFITNFSAQTAEYNGVEFTGIDANQKAYTVKKAENERLYLSKTDLAKVQTILDGNGSLIAPFSAHGLQIWNGQTLTLPMLDNHQSATAYKLKKHGVLSDISTTTRQLKFRTNSGDLPWKVLPKNAWAYDDSDFKNSDLMQNPKQVLKLPEHVNPSPGGYQSAAKNNNASNPENDLENGQHSSWLDAYAIDNSKFSYNEVFTYNSSTKVFNLNDKTYFFNDFAFDQNQRISSSYTRPYYQYKNIKLFLPKNLINPEDILNSSENASEITEPGTWFNYVHAQDKIGNDPTNDEYAVPNSVLNAWGLTREENPEFLVINPFDLSYKEGHDNGLDRLINGDAPYWLRYAFDSDRGPGAFTYNTEEPVVYGENNPNKTDFKINFQVVGTIDSYDSRLLLIDANLANMILGYSTARTVGASNSYFNEFKGVDEDHNDGSRPWTDKLNTYTFNSPQSEVLVQGNNQAKLASLTYLKNLKDANNYQPLKWHTGKLSNIEEPISLTSAVSFNVRDNLGQYAITLGYPLGLGVTLNNVNQTLLSVQKNLINQIYALAISLGALLIIAIVLTASLLIMLVGDVYIAQYLRFMILMRALGYSNRAIQSYAFGTVSVLAVSVWILMTILAWGLIFGAVKVIGTWGLAVPFALSWWPPLVSFVVIFISFFGSLLVSSGKVRKGEVSSLVNESNE